MSNSKRGPALHDAHVEVYSKPNLSILYRLLAKQPQAPSPGAPIVGDTARTFVKMANKGVAMKRAATVRSRDGGEARKRAATVEHKDLDAAIAAFLARGEEPSDRVADWMREYDVSRATVYRRIALLKPK